MYKENKIKYKPIKHHTLPKSHKILVFQILIAIALKTKHSYIQEAISPLYTNLILTFHTETYITLKSLSTPHTTPLKLFLHVLQYLFMHLHLYCLSKKKAVPS